MTGSEEQPTGIMSGVKEGYLRERPMPIIVLICIFAGTGLLYQKQTHGVYSYRRRRQDLWLPMNCTEASSTSRSLEVLDSVMAILSRTPRVLPILQVWAGLNVVTFAAKSNSGTVFAQSKTMERRGLTNRFN
jgi:HAE1 family hydrophobic/amphiphilic exporter-1